MDFLSGVFGGAKPGIEIFIDAVENRKKTHFRDKTGELYSLVSFYDKESISGKIVVNLNKAKKIEHQGIKVEIIGLIELEKDKKNPSRFINLTRDIEPPGVLTNEISTFIFCLNNVEKEFETYRGNNVSVKYVVRCTLTTKYKTFVEDQEFGVINPVEISGLRPYVPIKYEVGIEDWLHLIFEFERTKYHSRDCVSGTVTFKKVSIRLKSMELQIIKKETMGAGTAAVAENDVITKFEIMDGGPIKNETIPIRFYLSPYELCPSYSNVNNKFSVQYFLNLVLIDVEGRRYFKQHEIQIIRINKASSTPTPTG